MKICKHCANFISREPMNPMPRASKNIAKFRLTKPRPKPQPNDVSYQSLLVESPPPTETRLGPVASAIVISKVAALIK